MELGLKLAGPVPRALAWLLDFGWRAAALMALATVLPLLGEFGFGIFLIVWFLLEWVVPAWCEVAWGGATPGKKVMGLRVLRDDGAPVGWGPALSRNLLRFADFLPFLYLGGLVAMLCNREFKRLGDYVAGTVVVHADRPSDARRIAPADPQAPTRSLSLDEARAVLDLAERAPQLGPERSAELAALAASVLGGRGDVVALMRVANYLVGRSPGTDHAPG